MNPMKPKRGPRDLSQYSKHSRKAFDLAFRSFKEIGSCPPKEKKEFASLIAHQALYITSQLKTETREETP